VAVENNLSNNLQTYKQILMQSGKRVRLVLARNNEVFETTLHIHSIRNKMSGAKGVLSK
jgi:hypothetical protein